MVDTENYDAQPDPETIIKVMVTAEDIAKAERGSDTTKCVLAVAISRTLGVPISVGFSTCGELTGQRRYGMDTRASEVVYEWDRGAVVEPCEISIWPF